MLNGELVTIDGLDGEAEVGLTASMTGSSKDPDVTTAPTSDSSPTNRAFLLKAVAKHPLSISLVRLDVKSAYTAFASSEHQTSDGE